MNPRFPPTPKSTPRVARRRPHRGLLAFMEEQMIRWGRDVMHPSGNLLAAHGLEKFRTPGHGGSSRYRCAWKEQSVELHSSCAGIYGTSRTGFVFVRPRQAAYAYIHSEAPLPGRFDGDNYCLPRGEKHRLSFARAASDFLEWIAAYETWAADHDHPRRRNNAARAMELCAAFRHQQPVEKTGETS